MKIETFIDNRLQKGDIISTALIDAIRSSKMAVVVFSVNYATSSWCLDEVLHIAECMEKQGQVVIPVFYEVDPSHVRKQTESYEAAFAKLKERFKDKKVNKWRAALTKLANLSGFPSQQYRTDSVFIDAIVADILKKLEDMSSSGDHFKDLVGIDENVKGMKKLLQLDSRDVRIIGIWGMGGLGKTTLARVIFKQLSPDFEGRCFLENVRENSGHLEGLEKLKKNLFSELLEEKDLNRITHFHEERLRRKKVLIVLDDVDQSEQLDNLAGDHSWFGDGSRVIVTTRDKDVLRNRTEAEYKLEGLNTMCALELFHLKAFGTSLTFNDIEFSERVVDYAQGNPLALRVLGSIFRSKIRKNWEAELRKLKKSPSKDIQNVLRISYEGLDEQQKRVFLDIVCFVYSGTCRHYVVRQLGGGEWLEAEIDNLISRSLIIEERECLTVHDLIREMGREVVRQECIKEPGEGSRLWTATDCYHVLQNNTGTKTIEWISVDSHIEDIVELSPAVFSEMYKLRFLQIKRSNVIPPQQLEYLPRSLEYLEWYNWPFKSMPRKFSPHNLVELRMPFSKLERLWSKVQVLGNLKYVDLCYSKRLTDVSALSQAPKLESIDLSNCPSLYVVPGLRFGNLDKSYHRCNYRECSSLGSLKLSSCYELKVLPSIYGNVKELDLRCTKIKELPSTVTSLQSLEWLNLGHCSSLVALPVLPRNIRWLDLSGTAIEQVPSSSIELLSRLEELDLNFCTRLKHLPTTIYKLKSLRQISLLGCKQFETFSDMLEPMECLQTILLQITRFRELPSSVQNLPSSKRSKYGVLPRRRVLNLFGARVVLCEIGRSGSRRVPR